MLHEKADGSYAHVQKAVDALTQAGQIRRTKRYWIVNGFACEATAEACRALAELQPVGFVYRQRGAAQHAPARNRIPKPDADQVKLFQQLLKTRHDDTADPFDPARFEIPWNLKRVGADRAWTERNVTGRGIVVAVLDSGTMAIPALTRSLWKNPDETLNGKDDDGNGYVDDIFGYDFQRNSPYVVSASRPSHGTLCAGIIAGRPDGPEDRIVTGVAPRAQIMTLVGNGRLSAYEYALQNGADVLSMSYTLDAQNLGHYRGLYRTAHEHLAAAGLVSVGGAGNYAQRRPEGWQIGTPKDIPCVIAVAGITEDGKITDASSRGPVSWKGVRYYDPTAGGVPAPPSKPDVTACFGGYPMWTRVSVWEGRKKDRLKVVYEDGNGYVLAFGPRGNSFSGPHAAGVAALMLEANPQLPVWQLQRLMEARPVRTWANPAVTRRTGPACCRPTKPSPRCGRTRNNDRAQLVFRRVGQGSADPPLCEVSGAFGVASPKVLRRGTVGPATLDPPYLDELVLVLSSRVGQVGFRMNRH